MDTSVAIYFILLLLALIGVVVPIFKANKYKENKIRSLQNDLDDIKRANDKRQNITIDIQHITKTFSNNQITEEITKSIDFSFDSQSIHSTSSLNKYEYKNDGLVTIIKSYDNEGQLKEYTEFIKSSNNIEKGFLEIYNWLDETVRNDYYERKDENGNLKESWQISNIAYFESGKKSYKYENNLLTEEAFYDKISGQSENDMVFDINPKTITNYKYEFDSNDKVLKRMESHGENKFKETYHFTVTEDKSFDFILREIKRYSEIQDSDICFIEIISNMIESNKISVELEVESHRTNIFFSFINEVHDNSIYYYLILLCFFNKLSFQTY